MGLSLSSRCRPGSFYRVFLLRYNKEMPSNHIEKSYQALRVATDSAASKAQVKRELTETVVPHMRAHIDTIKSEVSRYHRGAASLNLDEAPPNLKEHVYELRHFLMDAERRLNAKVFKKAVVIDFGTDIKKSWMKTIFKDATDVRAICELTDSSAHQHEQDRVVKAVRSASPADGAKTLLAESRVALSAPSTGPERQLMHVMNELSNAARYELLSKVDLYIRSGHAAKDLTSKTKETQALRQAFSALDKMSVGDVGYTDALTTASKALYARFDALFLAVSVKPDKTGKNVAKVHGSLAAHEELLSEKRKEVWEGFVCERLAPAGYVDSVIMGVDGKTLYAGLATANDKALNLVGQGEQLGKQLLGLQGLVKEGQSVDATSIMRATHHDDKPRRGSQREEFFNQLGVPPTDTAFVEQLDKLQALTVLCAIPNAETRCKTRFLLVGKELDWDPNDYTPDKLAGAAVGIIKPILEKLGHPDFSLRPSSSKESLVNQVAQSLRYVIHQFSNTPALQSELPFLGSVAKRLDDVVEEAEKRKDVVIPTMDIIVLASVLSKIKPLLAQTTSMDMA